MEIKWIDLKTNKKLIFILIISIFIQITIFIIIQLSNWISQKPINEAWFVFLTQTIEPYSDYKIWYQTFVRQTFFEHWFPYVNILDIYVPEDEWYTFWFVENEDLFLDFIYPPFFFYVLILPSFVNIELAFLPLLIANILLPIVIYKFLIKSFDKKVAEWGFIATAINPLYIFYNGSLALNSSIMTLFFVVTLYFISTNRYSLSIIFLAISILFKQIIVFFIPPIMVYLVLNSVSDKNKASFFIYLKKFLKFSVLLGGVLFIGSLPWILITPENYLRSLFTLGATFPNFFPPYHFPYPHYNYPIFWYDFLYSFNVPYIVLWFFGFLNSTYIGIFSLEIAVIYAILNWRRKNYLNWVKFFDIIIYTAFLTHLFLPRGLYKYYFTLFVPLLILWICFHFGHNLSNKYSKGRSWILITVVISLIFMLLPRTYYLILIWSIFFYVLNKNRSYTKNELSVSQPINLQ